MAVARRAFGKCDLLPGGDELLRSHASWPEEIGWAVSIGSVERDAHSAKRATGRRVGQVGRIGAGR